MSDYVINDITFGTTGVSSVIEFNNYYKVKYNDDSGMQTDLRGMLRFELAPYAGVQKDSMIWTEPKLYFYAKLDNDEFGDTILGHEDAYWSKAYIDEINCGEINIGGNAITDIFENIVSLSYVTHYSSTSLTSNSTNSLSVIDNQDSVKVNDKVIDSAGKMFYITSVDLRNSEFTVGSVVDTFAKDSGVVHTNEINSLGIGIIEAVKEVGGVNFNTLTTQGLYGANASGSTNNPEASPCVVQVIRRQNSVIQIANVASSAYKSRYIRYCGDITAQSPVWQSWIKFATDDNVMHLTGNETKNGELTVSKLLSNSIQSATGNMQIQSNGSNRSVAVYNGSSAGDGGGFWAYGKDSANGSDCRMQIYNTSKSRYERVDLVNSQFLPNPSGGLDCGGTLNKWKTFNGLEPSALGMPDLDNAVDISGYITMGNTHNEYTPLVNGWISVILKSTSGACAVFVYQGDLGNGYYGSTTLPNESDLCAMANLPVKAGTVVSIDIKGSNNYVCSAKFYPCLGNI